MIVVNDASTDAALVEWLRSLADRRRITLVEQSTAQGVAAALNRAIALHRGLDRDVVIVRSECEVAGDWLDRLARHAALDQVGTVIPFASSGTVAGYPRSDDSNAMPQGPTLAELDTLFVRANAGVAVTLPLAYGPCVYVRRECLNAIGAFSAGPHDPDCGVIVDFSLRASSAGFRHVLAADCYIWRERVEASPEAIERSWASLDKRYPHLRSARSEIAHRDPARPFARRVDLLRLAESRRPLILFIAHAWGGGIRRHMNELIELVADHCEVLLLEPATANTVKLSWPRQGEGFSAYFALPDDTEELVRLLGEFGLVRIHFHHVHGLPRAVLDLPAVAGVPYDCTLHDYYAICPQYHLVTERRPLLWRAGCCGLRRVHPRSSQPMGTRDHGLARAIRRSVARCRRVCSRPSHDVARRIARYFPDLDITVLPHAETQPPHNAWCAWRRSADCRRKKACAWWSRAPLMRARAGCRWPFACSGRPPSRCRNGRKRRCRSTGSTWKPSLPALIAQSARMSSGFRSQVPESYSYTLSAALATGTAIVASSLGAFPERLAGIPRATLLPPDASARQWNDALHSKPVPRRVRVGRPRPESPYRDRRRTLSSALPGGLAVGASAGARQRDSRGRCAPLVSHR